jgi:dolichyl-phosphate-mannose--protein O-mannosyl transferase
VPALLVIVAVTLSLPRIAEPQKYLFDEILFAYTAGEMAEGNTDAYRWDHPCSTGKDADRCGEQFPDHVVDGRIGRYQWDHPPLARLAMTGGILLLGNEPIGWRIGSVVAGAVGAVLAFDLGRRLTGRMAVGVLTACLLLMDTMYLTYSRMGLLDSYLTMLTLAMMAAFAWYLRQPVHRVRVPLVVIGITMGLSIATKWSAAYGAFFVGIVILARFAWLAWRGRSREASGEMRDAIRQHLMWIPLGTGLVAIVTYLLTWIPFFVAGNQSPVDFIEIHRQTLDLHLNLSPGAGSSSRWWSWPLNLHPVWFGTRSFGDEATARTYAFGNPLLYWAILPAVAWTLVRWWRAGKTVGAMVLGIGVFGQWLPWMLIERSTYLYHFLPAVPFGMLAIAASVVMIVERWGDWRRTLAIQYVVAVAFSFAFFYPLATYLRLSNRELGLRRWLESWFG